MRQATRWFIAIPLALVFLGVTAAVHYPSFFLVGRQRDSERDWQGDCKR